MKRIRNIITYFNDDTSGWNDVLDRIGGCR